MEKAKRLPMSLTLRVLLFVMLAIGFSLVLSAHLILSAIQHHFIEQDTDELQVIRNSIAATLVKAEHNQESLNNALRRAVAGHHGVFYLVKNSRGDVIYETPGKDFWAPGNTPMLAEESLTPRVYSWVNESGSYRGVATVISTAEDLHPTVIALDMSFHTRFLKTFRRSLFVILLTTGVVTLFAAWLGIYQGHLPLRSLSKSIRQVQTNKLDIRIDPSSVPYELKELVLSFNHMIASLEEGFDRLSHFSSDIAHELRTPLTNIITQTQVVLSKQRDIEEYRELLYSSLEEQERLAAMVSDMLWLAKSENDLIKLDMQPLELEEEIRELLDFFDALAAEKQVKLVMEGDSHRVGGDRALLRRAISNLVSNAIRHTPSGGTVTVKLETVPGGLGINVINPGDAIPAKHLSKLFDRFYRADPSRQRNSEGAGLGLAITKSIVEIHGGSIQVKSEGGVTCFTIVLARYE